MKIYTTYFGNLRKIPKDIIPIAICAKPPVGYTGIHFKSLCPSYTAFQAYKSDKDFETFRQNYYSDVLAYQDADYLVTGVFQKVSYGKDVALVCFEKNPKECHRSILAEWLGRYGYHVEEWQNVSCDSQHGV